MSRKSVSSGRVTTTTIPSGVRKTIQNIKEITGNHSDDEIYAMLRECSMDPNETTHKLLFQDTFHQVKTKRDRKKEKPAVQWRANKGSRANFTSRDTAGTRNENGVDHIAEAKNTSSSLKANGPASIAFGSNNIIHDAHASAGGFKQSEAVVGEDSVKLRGSSQAPSHDVNKNPRVSRDMLGLRMPNSGNSSSGAYFSASDPVLVPSNDSRPPGAVGTIRREVGAGHSTPFQQGPTNSNESKTTSASDSRSSSVQVKISSKSQGPGKNQLPELSQSSSLAQGVSSHSRPSSNYNNRSTSIGQQKAGPGKEWKPKSTNNNVAQGSATSAAGSSHISTVSAEVDTPPQPQAVDVETQKGTTELQKKLEKSHISDTRHVIIPNHLHVPEVEKLGFCFGSFDSSLDLGLKPNNSVGNEKTLSLSETPEGLEETTNDQFPSGQNAATNVEHADCYDQSPPSSNGQESFSATPEDVSCSVPEYCESRQEIPQGGPQYSVLHTSPNYSFGFMPPTLGSQLAPIEHSESQSRDASRLPNFVVQQPIDPANYYAQFYRPSSDSDGRISPFHSVGISTKYNGNVAVVPPQSQSVQEVGTPLVLSTAAPTPLATQAAGLQSSAAVTQQPLPVFRHAALMHLPHYPPNFIPYAHYFSPYYVPPTAIHQFLSNGAFPQQPQAGNVYPPTAAAAARYSLSQYRPGANLGSSAHIGVPGSYGPYGSSTANYNNPNSTITAGNSAFNDDLPASQYRESNVHLSGQQQSEGLGVWITPGRDLSSLQGSSFYNLPQGQVAFTPTQPGHGALSGLYHPGQPVTAQTVHPLIQQSQTMTGSMDMVGGASAVYQQPQHSQINWPNSY